MSKPGTVFWRPLDARWNDPKSWREAKSFPPSNRD
jgi:hypothetical protein